MQHTIPQLELYAAALAIQVDATITRDISADIDLQSSVYWTDSMIVLAYLHDDSKRTHTFVRSRVARIISHYEASQWGHVPSEQNPADLASRGTLSVDNLAISEWFNGPKFITQQESEWPPCDQLVPVLDSDVEVKRNAISHMVEASMPSMIDDIVNKFSKLTKVKHVMAWVMLFIRKCRKQANGLKLSLTLIETATVKLLLYNQRDRIIADYQRFVPFTDNDGIVRDGGRLTFSNLPYPQPVIKMPGNLCDFIVEDVQSRLNHMGVEYTLSSLRSQGYWIRGKLVKSVLNRYRICGRLYARPRKQEMAPLPPERVFLTRFNKIATQGAPQMAVDKEANSLSRVYSRLLF